MQPKPELIVLVGDDSLTGRLVDLLESEGYRVGRADGLGQVARLIGEDRPVLVVRTAGSIGPEDSSFGSEGKGATQFGVPLLEIIEDGANPGHLVDRHGDADDWVYRSRIQSELPARVGRLLRRGAGNDAHTGDHQTNPIDANFLALVVHDLRTPLNVVGLSLRMIDQAIPRDDPELLGDLKFVEENFKQIERMLSQLSDYCRLYGGETSLTITEFSPARMIAELVEDRSMKMAAGSPPLRLRIDESCPAEATLDPGRARLAIGNVLTNALASTQDVPVEITMRGGPDRLITEVRIDQPPPASVRSVTLRPHAFERICGVAAERRGLDLAIAARVSELFGGTARLDAVEHRETTVVLDWPTRLARE